MPKETLSLKLDDGAEIFIRSWTQVKNPQGVLQIAHGMAEHSARYAEFATFCNEKGFIVVANDHRGHGQTGKKAGTMGYFAPKNGFDQVVDDLHSIRTSLKERYPHLPIFLMGHSMGSFLVRRYLQKYEAPPGVILMGSGGNPGFAVNIGKLLARLQMAKNPTKPSKLLDAMAFGPYIRGIQNPQTKFDWLTRNSEEVKKYMADPLCGFICSSGFFYDLFSGLQAIHDPRQINNMPKTTPILVVSGDADPVGSNGAGIAQFVGQLKKHGLTNIETKLYPGARHELLNEFNKKEVMHDLLQWLKNQLEDFPHSLGNR